MCHGLWIAVGKPVAWVEGFPFNLGLRHPQYVGNQLTWWAFYAVRLIVQALRKHAKNCDRLRCANALLQVLLSEASVSKGLLNFGLIVLNSYTVIAMTEEADDMDADSADQQHKD